MHEVELKLKAEKCRENILRMVKASGQGHVGGALSCIDYLTVLYFYAMRIYPKNPNKIDRDRFVLSAGHKCLAQYAVLAEKGFFNKDILDSFGSFNSCIPGHPDMEKLPGIEANTGALGHGLSIAVGMALALKAEKKQSKVYVVLGDGELAEGSNWEAIAAAAHYCLDNLVVFIDHNGLQISGKVKDIMNLTPIDKHFEGFGWSVTEIDGHDIDAIIETLKILPFDNGRPNLILAHTIKGKGISFIENEASSHYWIPCEKELQQAEIENQDRINNLAKPYMRAQNE